MVSLKQESAMLKFSKLLMIVAGLALLASCSGKHDDEPKGIEFKASEILVRQCQDISNLELKKLFEEHELEVKRQVSEHLYVVTWDDDDRSADEVVHELNRTQKFCGVEKYQKQ